MPILEQIITIPSQLKLKDTNAILELNQCIEVGELIVETEILRVKHAKIWWLHFKYSKNKNFLSPEICWFMRIYTAPNTPIQVWSA